MEGVLLLAALALTFAVPVVAMVRAWRASDECPEREPDWVEPEDREWLSRWAKSDKWRTS